MGERGWGQGWGRGCKISPQTAIPVPRRQVLETPGGGTCWLSCLCSAGYNPRIFLLSKGVFPAPDGVWEPWWGWLYPGAGGAFAAVSLGTSPLLKNEHVIKKQTKKQNKNKKNQTTQKRRKKPN